MLAKFARPIAWATLAFVVLVTVSPLALRPDFGHVNIERFAGFAALAFLFGLAYPRRLILLCVIVVGVAGLLEYAQLFIPGRDAAMANFLIKMAGGFLGLGIAGALNLALEAVGARAGARDG